MKLIDLLVQELPKRGGWPEGVAAMAQDFDGDVQNYADTIDIKLGTYASGSSRIHGSYSLRKIKAAEDRRNAFVTREQYEAALAAAQQPVWDGEGLPPVGCRIEAFSGGEWVEAIVTYNEPPECHGDAAAWKEVLAFDCKTTRPFWTDEFRPIRSEADKRRDEAIAALKKLKSQLVGELAGYLYDEIAAGKIPHIRIEQAA
ncbi:hypothetical protein QMT05_03160 [Cronobacter malonaticus]|uniref:hypothetical protein n=1 Tax=Cronobacter malonaticus TaxID=413503 RepID=UPI0024C2F93A|nr:hypothetical protein [Cronobacter malonaticus]MDK1175874.1 hypothetical protein [Cronobacter malonaticus]MDK1685987.1 hypothetical protein [Cronobacter malonaticus]